MIPENKDRKWRVVLVDDDEPNAFALPSGMICVNTGLFHLLENEHELAMVMAHEMSHVILGHGAENLTRSTVFDFGLTLLFASLWCIMPSDGIALVASWFCDRVAKIMFQLPFSRKLEREADMVGVEFIARSCFDPRRAAVVWKKFAIFHEIVEEYKTEQTKSKNQTRVVVANSFVMKLSQFYTSNLRRGLSEDDKPKTESKSEKSSIEKLVTETDFFMTHPLPGERYKNICDAIGSGKTDKAAIEGGCDLKKLKIPLPTDYDSHRKLRTDLVISMQPFLNALDN